MENSNWNDKIVLFFGSVNLYYLIPMAVGFAILMAAPYFSDNRTFKTILHVLGLVIFIGGTYGMNKRLGHMMVLGFILLTLIAIFMFAQ